MAAFALLLLISAFFLHRIFGMPTLTALNLAKLAYFVAGISMVLAFFAGYAVWRTGAAGTGNVAIGVLVSVGILLGPPLALQAASDKPLLNDVTTDFQNPPPFQSVTALRSLGANPVRYPRAQFASRQQEAYPDIKPMIVNRSAQETFAHVVEALKRENLTVVRQDPPSEDGTEPGFVEATDRTLVFGFYDDVAIRVADIGDSARVDMRSASRFGRHDLGRNATRVRTLMRQIVVRLEETITARQSIAEQKKKDKKAKQDESARRAKVSARRSQARARASARRARERRARRRQKQIRVPNYISPIPGF